jgi:hypothetical protein
VVAQLHVALSGTRAYLASDRTDVRPERAMPGGQQVFPHSGYSPVCLINSRTVPPSLILSPAHVRHGLQSRIACDQPDHRGRIQQLGRVLPDTPHRAANDSTSSRRSEGRARLKVRSCFLRTAGVWVTATPHAAHAAAPQRCSEAILAPCAWERNLAQVTVGTTVSIPAIVPNPQSVPAITLSRPTTSA